VSKVGDELLAAVAAETGWTTEETRNFLSCMRGDTPEALLDACAAATAWAMRIETKAALVSVMKRLPRGAIQAEWTGDDIAVRLNPESTITTGADGTINIDWPEDDEP
jgi:hypothetical protein